MGVNMQSANSVADYFIKKSQEASSGEYKKLSPLKLQKILYYAQGWHLGVFDKPLFKESVYAWRLGPVVKEIYDRFKIHGRSNLAEFEWSFSHNFDDETKKFLDEVWEQYGSETADKLVDRTHLSVPWVAALRDPFSDEITQSSMKSYFAKLR
jgi:uncharacterized phage-associated protein